MSPIALIVFSVIFLLILLIIILIYSLIIKKPNKEFSAYRKNFWENMIFVLLMILFGFLTLIGAFIPLTLGSPSKVTSILLDVIGIIIAIIGVVGIIGTPIYRNYLNAKRIDKIHQKEVEKIKNEKKQ